MPPAEKAKLMRDFVLKATDKFRKKVQIPNAGRGNGAALRVQDQVHKAVRGPNEEMAEQLGAEAGVPHEPQEGVRRRLQCPLGQD